jgi:hypothetical protein
MPVVNYYREANKVVEVSSTAMYVRSPRTLFDKIVSSLGRCD